MATTISTTTSKTDTSQTDQVMDDLFFALGKILGDVGFAFQFPWIVRYAPCLRKRVLQRKAEFHKAAAAFQPDIADSEETGTMSFKWLPPLVKLLQSEVDATVQLALNMNDQSQWPPWSSVSSLSRRFAAVIPRQWPSLQQDPGWAVRGYAVRFALAFSVAMLPDLLTEPGSSGHWFPMTVAFLMGPTSAATFEKVVHRTIGTICGIGCLLYTSPSPRDQRGSRMPSSA